MTDEPKPPSHYAECKALATWMDNREIVYCHVPNEAALDAVVGRRIKEQGGKAGVPDFLIFSLPPAWRRHGVLNTSVCPGSHQPLDAPCSERVARCPVCVKEVGAKYVDDSDLYVYQEHIVGLHPPRGVAIEMKKRDRERPSREQAWWLETLASLGWLTKKCNGGSDARAFLVELGFPKEATIELPKRKKRR